MDKGVPERFSTPRADIDIVTRAARAPALLTAYKVAAAGERLQVDMHLQTGVRTVRRQTLGSVVAGPFRTTSASAAGALLPAVSNVGYLLHSFAMSGDNTAATAGVSMWIGWDDIEDASGAQMGEVTMFAVPSVVGAYSLSGILDALTLPGRAVECWANGAFSHTHWTLTYSLVSGVM